MSLIFLTSALAALTAGSAGPGHSHATLAQQAAASSRTEVGEGLGLYMISGRGGNILFSVGNDGTFVIDDQFADNAAQNLNLIKEVSPTAVVFVLNTHHHGDHTGGNITFAQNGATILSHDNVRKRLASAENANPAGFPVITFSDTATFNWNEKEIHVFHIPNAHTDGDALVHFRDANVIHTGDTMFAGRYPFIDLDSGGSVAGAIEALTAVHDAADENTVIVPGHGPLSSKGDVAKTIELIETARDLVRVEMLNGLDEDAVVATDPLADYNETYSWRFIDGERMTRTLVRDLMATDDEAKAAVEAGPVSTDSAEDTAAGGGAGVSTTDVPTSPPAPAAPFVPVAETSPVTAPATAPATTQEAEQSIAEQLNAAQSKAIEAGAEGGSSAAKIIKDLTDSGADAEQVIEDLEKAAADSGE